MKIFVISDVHSAYTQMKQALDEAGFDPNNQNHLLVSCGDNFDRMHESQKVLDYLLSVPNKVLVKGNHESLLEALYERAFALSYDWHNCTADTVLSFAPHAKTWGGACLIAEQKTKPLLDQMVNYYESAHYIFVHSWIPFGKDWRDASQSKWDTAMWGNPFEMAAQGLNQTGKTIVFGHWHCSWQWSRDGIGSEWGDDACFKPYHGDGFIGLDSCVARSEFCNVVVLEDELIS